MQPSYIGDVNEVIQEIATGITPAGVRVIAVARTSAKNGSGVVVYSSTDGKLWTTKFYNLPSPTIVSVAFLENSGTLVAISGSNTTTVVMYISTDFGATWTPKTTTHGVTLAPTGYTTIMADNKRNRLMICSMAVTSSATIRNLVLQSFDVGTTWTAAVTATQNNTRAILTSMPNGNKGIIGRLFPNTSGGDNTVFFTNSTDNTITSNILPAGTAGPLIGTRGMFGVYVPLTDQYVFPNVNLLQVFNSDLTTMTVPQLGFTLNGSEYLGNIMYYAPSNEVLLATYNNASAINQANTRFFKSKTGDAGWVLDPTPIYNQSEVQFPMNSMFMDPSLGIITGYIQANVMRGAGIGYIGTGTNMPTPTPSPTATMSATPAILSDDVRVYGRIGQANGIPQTGYTLFNHDGTEVLSIDAGLLNNEFIQGSFHVTGTNELIVFGQYTTLNGIPQSVAINRIDRVGTINPTWSVTGITNSRNISAMVKVSDNEYYFAVNGGRVYKMNGNGVVDTAWGSALGNYGNPSLLIDRLDPNKLYIGSNARIVKVDIPTGTLDTSFAAVTINNTVTLAQQSTGQLLAFGQFTVIAGISKGYYARINTNGTVDNTFTISVTTGSGINVPLDNIHVYDDDSFITGGFQTAVDGQAAGYNYLTKFKSNGRIDASFAPNISGSIYGIKVLADGKILIGGGNMTINGVSKSGTARLNYNGSLDTTFTGTITTNVAFGIAGYEYPLVSLTPTQTPSVTPTHTPVPSAIYDQVLAYAPAVVE